MWAAIIALIGQLLSIFTRKDERDTSHDQGEAQGVAETQAATAQKTIQEAKDAARTQDDVSRLSDSDLDRELRDGSQ